MIDRIFSAALTFCLLIAGTLAIGAAMFGVDQRSVAASKAVATPVRIVQLEKVTVVGKRAALPTEIAQSDNCEPAAPRM